MGFHILNIKGNKLEHYFIQNKSQLLDIEFITIDTIIYQGEENWKPVRVGDSEEYKRYSENPFIAGMKAQKLFKEQAKRNNLIVEEISQSSDSFKDYFVENNFVRLKRGDFLIRNYANLEVEVKCKKLYGDKNKFFYFEKDHLEGHTNMQHYTKTPVIIVFYEKNEDGTLDDNPYFISIDNINTNKSKYSSGNKNGSSCYLIPVTELARGFSFIANLSK